MAVLKFSGLVSAIQGKLNGSVLSPSRSGFVLTQIPRQRKEPTAAQLAVRSNFSSASYFWRQLTTTEKEDWQTIADAHPVPNRFGDLYALPAFQYYKRMQALYHYQSTPDQLPPDLSNDPPYEFEITEAGLVGELSAGGYFLSIAGAVVKVLSSSPANNFANVYVSLPIPEPAGPYFKTWYFLGRKSITADAAVDDLIELIFTDVTLPPGWRAFNGSKLLIKVVSFIPAQGVVSVDAIADFEAEIVAPVAIPVLSFDPISGPSWFLRDTLTTSQWYTWLEVPDVSFDPDAYKYDFDIAPPQVDESPVDPLDWVTAAVNTTISFYSYPYFQGKWAATAEQAAELYFGLYPDAYTDPPPIYVPFRIRLFDLASSSYGDWQAFFQPMSFV